MGPIADWQCNWYFKREAGLSPMNVRGRDGFEGNPLNETLETV